MVAMTTGQSKVVDLLKNKYGQQEPFAEAVSGLLASYVAMYIK